VREWGLRIARSNPLGSILVVGALVAYCVATVAVIYFFHSLTPRARGILLFVSLGSWALLVLLGWARGTLPKAAVIGAICLTLGAAIAAPSNQSKDVYSYAMYGRIAAVYHENPFSRYPVHFEGDPMRRYVGQLWQRTPDIYGPAFTAMMAGLAPVNGESTFRVRFSYQLIAAAAFGAILWLLWRRTRSVLVLAFAGLHPLATVSVVNGGHPDALVALGVLLGVLLAMERRVLPAAFAFAFATAVNFTTVTVPIVMLVWAWRRWSRKEVTQFGAISIGLGALPYFFLGGWINNAREHSKLLSRQSLWNAVMSIANVRSHIPNGTTLLVGTLMLLVLWRQARVPNPEAAAAAALVVFVVASPWVMPWYGFAALPLVALRKPSLLAWVIALDAGLILAGDQFTSLGPAGVGALPHALLQVWIPFIALAACAVAIVRRPRAADLTEPPAQPALV
jgi:hypothetical protein